ncbi:MAG: hypothetical protein PF447_08085 [Spirochaetaceae bacterium]|jgi:hypothetical protein|nr:hypothetical protein [Spirochaetaceae bacterium]
MSDFPFISLRLADNSLYSLFSKDEWGSKEIVLSAMNPAQERVELFFIDKHNKPLKEISIEKSEVSQGQWGELTLRLELLRSSELSIKVLQDGVEVIAEHCTAEGEPPTWDSLDKQSLNYHGQNPLSQQRETKADAPSSLGTPLRFFTFFLSALLLGITITASFVMGNYLSTPMPPELSTQQHWEQDQVPVR